MRGRVGIPILTPWQVLIRSILICGLLWVLVFGLSLRKIEHLPLSGVPLQFNSERAYSSMWQLSKQFPGRTTWSDSRRKAAAWLKSEFAQMGYAPKSMLFSEVIAGKQYTDLENLYVEKKGTHHPDEIILVVAHYDIADTTSEGAMDDASGVGVVLELARIFAQQPTRRSLIFLLTDSEEFGAFWGARSFAQDFERADQIVAAINFDFLAPETQTGILTLCDGLKQGYTPLWLREIALDSLRSFGDKVETLDLVHVVEHIERAMQIPAADHGAFLAAGIPSFNWVGQTSNFAFQMAHYHHTLHDVAEALKPASFEPFGRGAERAIHTIDELPKIPLNFRDSSYLKISRSLYVPGWAVTLLHILSFIPFLAYGVVKSVFVFRRQNRFLIFRILRNEAKNVGILLGSLLLGYVVMILLPALKIITQYETFPATQKSLILYHPDFIAILIVILSILGVYFLFKHTFAEPDDSIESREVRHAFHAAFLAIIIFLALVKNSYLATLLLLPPAYFWTAMRAKRRIETRIANMLLILAGAVTFVATVMILATIFHVGVVYWYIFLSASYGLISAYAVVLFFMALTVMIRLIRAFVL